MNWLILCIGLFLLYKGASLTVDQSTRLARQWGLSEFFIGATIVAVGTSLPEFIVSLISDSQGNPQLVTGTILGANINNVLFTLGLVAIIAPIKITKSTLKQNLPLIVLSSIALLFLANDALFGGNSKNSITRLDGLFLVLIYVYYLTRVIIRREHGHIPSPAKHQANMWYTLSLLLFGIGLLIAGGSLVVDKAVIIATNLGISQRAIGVTVVAFGTSLPELTTLLIGHFKGRDQIAIGNIISSVTMNITLILGGVAMIRPLHNLQASVIDIAVMLFSIVILFISVIIGKKNSIDRSEGIIFMIVYCAYIYSLF